ncbi:MAG: efflux RND transporter periplasmic adaptor subunit [Deferribacterales bacterium]
MKLIKQMVTILLAVIVIWGGYLLYKKLIMSGGKSGMPHVPQVQEVPVDIYIAKKDTTIPYKLEYPGRLKTYRSIDVIARVNGIVTKRYYNDGDYVVKDSILFDIEDDVYRAKVKQAEASVENQMAILKKAESELKRVKTLYNEKIASQQDYDAALAQYESAAATLKMLQALLDLAKIDLGYTKVRAPISGVLSTRKIDKGGYVQSGMNLVTIQKIDPVYIEFSIPDSDNKRFNIVQLVRAKGIIPTMMLDGKRLTGEVEFIDSVMDQSTATIKVRAVFSNKNNKLLPGDFVRVTLDGFSIKEGVKIPTKALIQNPMGTGVYVVNNGVAEMRSVHVVSEKGDFTIVGQGINNDEKVIVNNFFKLKPGVPVKIDKVLNGESK